MTKDERLEVLSKHKSFKTCDCCGFVYLPTNKYTLHNCPKCEPIENELSDEEYLNNEDVVYEEINTDNINEPEPMLAG